MKKYITIVLISAAAFLGLLITSTSSFASCGSCGGGSKPHGDRKSISDLKEASGDRITDRNRDSLKDIRRDKSDRAKVGRDVSGITESTEGDTTTRTHTDSAGNTARTEETTTGGDRIVTDFNTNTGKPLSELTTDTEGGTVDVRYDARTGEKISSTEYNPDGSLKEQKTWGEGGGMHTETRHADGTYSLSSSMPGEGTGKSTYHADGTLKSTSQSNGMRVSYTNFDNNGNVTSEGHLNQGMDVSKTYHGADGENYFEYNLDGSVESQTHTPRGGEPSTTNYDAGEYFEFDGEVKHMP